jgi:hypothetical protein
MSLGIFKKAFNSTQISDLTAYFSTLFPQKTYKEYSVLITQASTSAPTANVLVDDFDGNLVLSRSSTGVYYITSPTAIFVQNKTSFFITNNGTYDVTTSPYNKVNVKMSWLSTTQIKLETFLVNTNVPNGIVYDDVLYKTPLTIKVYN